MKGFFRVSQSTATIDHKPIYAILFAISFTHLLNDMLQSIIPSIYPMLKTNFHLTYSQIGLVTFVFQITASLLQPFVGQYTDRTPRPYSLAIGMTLSLVGLLCLAFAPTYGIILLSVSLLGIGSSIFHPESSRVAHLASGGQRGLAQSIFQLGGNAGSAVGPLLAALIVVPYGQHYISWFTVIAMLAIVVLVNIGRWYKVQLAVRASKAKSRKGAEMIFSNKRIIFLISILIVLIFSKYFYLASMVNYFTFYLIDKFHVTVQQSQFYLFVFLASVAAGTIIGGPLGDRFGRKYIILISIFGIAPFALVMPYVNLFWTMTFAVINGVILASAFSSILVYAQELVPGKVGMIAGLFFGFAFGMGGLGSALLGKLADLTSINYVFHVCSFLPLIGAVGFLLPDTRKLHHEKAVG